MNKKLFNYLNLMFMYGIGLFTGSFMGRFWIVYFLLTGIISSSILITFEILRMEGRWE